MRILFSGEKIDDIYNSQNERIWAVNRKEANDKGGIKKKRKFSQKVMVWLGVCSKGVSPLVILDQGTLNHTQYIQKILPLALKYSEKVFGDDWTFQHDDTTPHTARETQA